MKQVVTLGYAIDNGKTGKDYAIRLKENTGNSSNKPPQSFGVVGTEPGNSSSNNLVTTADNKPEVSLEQALRLDDTPDSLSDSSISVTTEPCSRNSNNGKAISTSSVDLLLDVTSAVTTAHPMPSDASTAVCYPVTDTALQVGDRVVLTRGGVNCPRDELGAIWTVKAIQEQKVAIHCERLGDRVFPLDWVERYERTAT